jgi:hypothetical protein
VLPADLRCALAARARYDDLAATAPPAHRFLLVEVPGPWASSQALVAARLPVAVARALRDTAAAAGARILLIRRPGRHPAVDEPRTWVVADLRAGALRRGLWTQAEQLLDVDVAAPGQGGEAAKPRPLALVCTHARHDQCCAIDGRPVVRALREDGRCEVWECSHLGGDRFAANALILPSGDMFGRLSAADVPSLMDAVTQDRVLLPHYRGRCGDPHVVQSARWHAMRLLGENRPGEVGVESVKLLRELPDVAWFVAVVRHAGRFHDIRLRAGWSEPAKLTCRSGGTGRARTFTFESLTLGRVGMDPAEDLSTPP